MQKSKTQKSEKESKLLLLTGGHAGSTALAIVEELVCQGFKNIHWAGPKYSKEGSKAQTFEFKVFPEKGVVCHPVRAGRWQRKLTRYSLWAILKVPLGFWDALGVINGLRPEIILSFGGFAAFPLVVFAWLKKIPVVIHEQTTAAGMANRLSAPFASKIAISREESCKFFPAKKIVLVGNPIRQSIRSVPIKSNLPARPTIFVTGGSRGSVWINNALKEIVSKLIQDFSIIHQCSDVDFREFKKIRTALGKNKNYYEVKPFYPEAEINGVFNRADILVGRAGANTVSEIIYLRLPSILIPIPWVQQNEQYKNAKMAEITGIARIISQDALNPEFLLKTLYEIKKNWYKMVHQARAFKNIDARAHKNLVKLLDDFLQ